MKYEYVAIPAPTQSKRIKGVKTAVERLAFAMTDSINEMADEGWEYMRTETLTVEDKPGRLSKIVERIETVMIFRREQAVQAVANPLIREKRQTTETHSAEPVPAAAAPAREIEPAAPTPKMEEEPIVPAKSMREEPPVMMTRKEEPPVVTRPAEEPARSLGGVSRD